MAIGDSLRLGQYELTFKSLYQKTGANYDAQGGVFDLKDGRGKVICQPKPQRRFYPTSNQVQSKVALCFTPLDDLYVVMAEPQAGMDGGLSWQVRFFYNPWVRLIFFGPLLMALGGVLSLCDRRLRLGIVQKAQKSVVKG